MNLRTEGCRNGGPREWGALAMADRNRSKVQAENAPQLMTVV